MSGLQNDSDRLKFSAIAQGTNDMAQAPSQSSALRGTKTLTKAFFAAADAIAESDRPAVIAAALAQIREEIKVRREKAAAAAAKVREKAAKAPAVKTSTKAKTPAKAVKTAAPAGRARKASSKQVATTPPQAQTGVATEA